MEWYVSEQGVDMYDAMLTNVIVSTRVADCLDRLLGMGSSKGTHVRHFFVA